MAAAALFNLIVYANEEHRSTEFRSLVRLILDKFPVHLITIQEQHQQPFVEQAENRILLTVESGQLTKAPYLILPQLIPDLPIYLILGEDPTKENRIVTSLQKWVKRVIFDCQPPKDLNLWSQQLINLIESTSLDLVDMNWARVAGWRAILAQIFDSMDRVADLSISKKIRITYNRLITTTNAHPEIQALFLERWLASKLGWEFNRSEREDEVIKSYYETEKGSLHIELAVGSEPDFPPGEVIAMDILGREDQTYSLVRHEMSQVMVHNATQDLCYLPFSLSLANVYRGRQFLMELLYRPITQNYLQVLAGLR